MRLIITHCPSVDVYTEADLGMFSVFGRTGTPQKDKKIFKLPVSCCCNSSVHCSTGPQQNVGDDYCVCRPRQCRVKAVGGVGFTGIHVLGAPTFFSEQWPHLELFRPCVYMSVVQKVIATIGLRLCLFPAQLQRKV